MDFSVLESVDTTTVVLTVLLVALAFWIVRRTRADKAATPAPGRPRTLDAVDTLIGWPPEPTRVMTLRQQRAYELLRRGLPEHVILAQVPLSHFIKVPTRHSYAEWLRRVGHVCVDLMVCDAASNVVAVVEVRQADKVLSERASKRQARVERVLRAAGITLHVWNEAFLPDPVTVRRTFVPSSAAAREPDNGPDTSPMAPRTPHARTPAGVVPPGQAGKEPPGNTWFDELNATQPSGLDNVEVTALEGDLHGASLSAFHPAAQGASQSHR